jgi:hypothetical protein
LNAVPPRFLQLVRLFLFQLMSNYDPLSNQETSEELVSAQAPLQPTRRYPSTRIGFLADIWQSWEIQAAASLAP